MTRTATHRTAASLWLVLLLALGGAVLPPLHRLQHAVHADGTTAGDDAASCDLLRATLAAPLPAPVAVMAPSNGQIVSAVPVREGGVDAVVEATTRGPPRA